MKIFFKNKISKQLKTPLKTNLVKRLSLKRLSLKRYGHYKRIINKKRQHTILKKKLNFSIQKKSFSFFKLKKKWRHWRLFKRYFLSIKRIKFYTKLQWKFNNVRILWHQLRKFYFPSLKRLIFKRNKIGHNKFCFFLQKLELRLCVILLRSRFCYKLINAYTAIKMNFVLVNGMIINTISFLLTIQDLVQKRRVIKKRKLKFTYKARLRGKRVSRFKWRKYRWKKARFVIWKIRRLSHFNLYWSKKQNTVLNYLEINYKVPAVVIIKQPFFKELFLNKQHKILTSTILKKIYFLY